MIPWILCLAIGVADVDEFVAASRARTPSVIQHIQAVIRNLERDLPKEQRILAKFQGSIGPGAAERIAHLKPVLQAIKSGAAIVPAELTSDRIKDGAYGCLGTVREVKVGKATVLYELKGKKDGQPVMVKINGGLPYVQHQGSTVEMDWTVYQVRGTQSVETRAGKQNVFILEGAEVKTPGVEILTGDSSRPTFAPKKQQ